MKHVISQTQAVREQMPALSKILVAQDFSAAADRALEDAMALSQRFHTEIVIAHINPLYSNLFEFSHAQPWQDPDRVNMENRIRRVALAGHPCRELMRFGEVAKTIAGIVEEECADLLLLGAYGDGPKDRLTLGNTAERLLRSVSCPILTYGPKVIRSLFREKGHTSILLPIDLPCHARDLAFVARIAKLFNAEVEVLHVVDMSRMFSMPHGYQDVQYLCEKIATSFREQDVIVSDSLLFGKPDEIIVSRSRESHSSFIVIPLESRERFSSTTSDNVAANVIRNAEVPVMTYRID